MQLQEYVEQVVKDLPCSKREKQDIKDELLDHLGSMKWELIEEGYEEAAASAMAIQRFGSHATISQQLKESMPLLDKYVRKWVMSLFGLYLAITSYLVLLSPDRWQRRAFTIDWKQRMIEYGVPEYTHLFQNTKPLSTLIDYVIHSNRYSAYTLVYNLFGNIALFMPLGMLLPLLFPTFQSIHRIFFTALLASLGIEFLQFLFALGSFDVDDLLLNVVGALLGYGVFKTGAAIMKRKK
ncbi:hypothetical protein BRE01_22550 [Brevibacillus reuszeri]|uniref:Antibiotic resistance protein VanZ n=1 Tax=Brevibacillus reuszeri TaxID=54915 RepID=A0A0K9YWV1_9BACL|nr:VanZ family protein [Brevibacillus reuszeri]KNB73107.1 antibiotic resistance protein VanZ [Brevibacillus reuszeri]MED1856700.1 VanZ family protein [Brevibacillus reuszeri]GED68553.1 hypothetical protein BRE01_22550 [Brevibacillus reuszeri]